VSSIRGTTWTVQAEQGELAELREKVKAQKNSSLQHVKEAKAMETRALQLSAEVERVKEMLLVGSASSAPSVQVLAGLPWRALSRLSLCHVGCSVLLCKSVCWWVVGGVCVMAGGPWHGGVHAENAELHVLQGPKGLPKQRHRSHPRAVSNRRRRFRYGFPHP
jgi:hypothetical protein